MLSHDSIKHSESNAWCDQLRIKLVQLQIMHVKISHSVSSPSGDAVVQAFEKIREEYVKDLTRFGLPQSDIPDLGRISDLFGLGLARKISGLRCTLKEKFRLKEQDTDNKANSNSSDKKANNNSSDKKASSNFSDNKADNNSSDKKASSNLSDKKASSNFSDKKASSNSTSKDKVIPDEKVQAETAKTEIDSTTRVKLDETKIENVSVILPRHDKSSIILPEVVVKTIDNFANLKRNENDISKPIKNIDVSSSRVMSTEKDIVQSKNNTLDIKEKNDTLDIKEKNDILDIKEKNDILDIKESPGDSFQLPVPPLWLARLLAKRQSEKTARNNEEKNLDLKKSSIKNAKNYGENEDLKQNSDVVYAKRVEFNCENKDSMEEFESQKEQVQKIVSDIDVDDVQVVYKNDKHLNDVIDNAQVVYNNDKHLNDVLDDAQVVYKNVAYKNDKHSNDVIVSFASDESFAKLFTEITEVDHKSEGDDTNLQSTSDSEVSLHEEAINHEIMRVLKFRKDAKLDQNKVEPEEPFYLDTNSSNSSNSRENKSINYNKNRMVSSLRNVHEKNIFNGKQAQASITQEKNRKESTIVIDETFQYSEANYECTEPVPSSVPNDLKTVSKGVSNLSEDEIPYEELSFGLLEELASNGDPTAGRIIAKKRAKRRLQLERKKLTPREKEKNCIMKSQRPWGVAPKFRKCPKRSPFMHISNIHHSDSLNNLSIQSNRIKIIPDTLNGSIYRDEPLRKSKRRCRHSQSFSKYKEEIMPDIPDEVLVCQAENRNVKAGMSLAKKRARKIQLTVQRKKMEDKKQKEDTKTRLEKLKKVTTKARLQSSMSLESRRGSPNESFAINESFRFRKNEKCSRNTKNKKSQSEISKSIKVNSPSLSAEALENSRLRAAQRIKVARRESMKLKKLKEEQIKQQKFAKRDQRIALFRQRQALQQRETLKKNCKSNDNSDVLLSASMMNDREFELLEKEMSLLQSPTPPQTFSDKKNENQYLYYDEAEESGQFDNNLNEQTKNSSNIEISESSQTMQRILPSPQEMNSMRVMDEMKKTLMYSPRRKQISPIVNQSPIPQPRPRPIPLKKPRGLVYIENNKISERNTLT